MRTGWNVMVWSSLALALAAGTGLCGCASFWDDVTSREFRLRHLFHRTDPMTVLREKNPDGDKRQKALLALREPKEHGGNDTDQAEVLNLLREAAVNDRQVICRVAAIQSLARFKDPEAARILENAYYQASTFKPANPVQPVGFNAGSSFLPETATVIRCQAIQALGQVGQPAAMELLLRVLKQPAGEGTDAERQTKMDERIAAARALGAFKHAQASEVLVGVLESEKDVALRNAAHESLQQITGNSKPAPEAKAWREALAGAANPVPEARSSGTPPRQFPGSNR